MERVIKHLIIIASLMTVELSLTESKDDEIKKKNKLERHHYHPIFTNICDIVDRKSKIHCYCDNTQSEMATWADCWIFTGPIPEDDPVWPSFSSQPLIEHLIFNVRSDYALTFIPAKALIRLDRLRHLTIQFGTIKTIPQFAFTNSTTLREILLKTNKIKKLEVNSFSRLKMLSNLSLEDNQISELKRGVFSGLPNLHILHLSNNNLSLVHEGCFTDLNNLIELNLDSNFISVVTREMFEGLENLARLDLRSNKLTMIGNLAFSDLWGLKELYLDNNAIEYISERSFGGLKQLKKLSLSGNRLTSFYEDIIENIRSLLLLDLSDNLLETMSYETIRSVVENDIFTSAVYLDGNPFKCDCRLAWAYTVRNQTDSQTLRDSLDKISCVTVSSSDRRRLIENQLTNTVTNTYENYEYYVVEKTDNVIYDEVKKVESHVKLLANLPIDSLPCPKELQHVMEESNHPIQNEIRLKAFSDCKRAVVDFKIIVLVLVFTFC